MSDWRTIEEIARELRVTPRTVRAWVAKGRLRAVRPGRALCVSAEDFAAFVAQSAVVPQGKVQPRRRRSAPRGSARVSYDETRARVRRSLREGAL